MNETSGRNPEWFEAATTLLDSAVESRAFPAATVEVGSRDTVFWRGAFGDLTFDAASPRGTLDTIFDLASLTKVIATTSIAMRLVEARRFSFDDLISRHVLAWRQDDRRDVTLAQLFDHSSGLPAHVRLFERSVGREAFEAAICAQPLAYSPGTAAVYSDLGFMLLGFVLERIGAAPLDTQFDAIAGAIGEPLMFRPAEKLRASIAPTEIDPWRGRLLQGEVHDENAAALGGVAGHAGLFGTARAVGRFAQVVLQTFHEPTWLGSPSLMKRVARKSDVPGSSRALGWDTMLPTSSCGTRMSPQAIGHTGFTGTSAWIDPANDVYVVLLTNRVHPTRSNDALVRLRPLFHDAVMTAALTHTQRRRA